jgi:hypothetical protein
VVDLLTVGNAQYFVVEELEVAESAGEAFAANMSPVTSGEVVEGVSVVGRVVEFFSSPCFDRLKGD